MKNSQHFHFSIAKRFADFGLFDKLKKHATDLYDDHTDTETYDDIFEPFFPDDEEDEDEEEDEEDEETTKDKAKVKLWN